METIRQYIEKLLRLAAANPAYLPELLRVLEPLNVTCLGHVVIGAESMPWTQINGCMHQGRLVLPCFTSPKALRLAGLDDEPCLTATFTEFLALTKSYGKPIVVNPDSPSEWTILPEQLVAIPATTLAVPRGMKTH